MGAQIPHRGAFFLKGHKFYILIILSPFYPEPLNYYLRIYTHSHMHTPHILVRN